MNTPDFTEIRKDFPLIEAEEVVYLDNAATTQKPKAVLDCERQYYETTNANVHRGAHRISERATEAYEEARNSVKQFLNASTSSEIVWTRGTTEAINLISNSYARSILKPGDAVVITELEHHSNIVPWQMVCLQTGATLRAARVLDDGTLDLKHYHSLLDDNTKIVSVGHVSNALGTLNPVKEIVRSAHEVGAIAIVDGAQGAAHFPVDVQDIGCDFYAFSGHKVYAPTGIGILFGKAHLLETMPPWQGGGEMIETVSLTDSTFQKPPFKFEAGTPNIAGALGLQTALNYFSKLDQSTIFKHESELLNLATARLQQIEGLKIVGTAPVKGPVLSFIIEGTHPQDVGTLLDQQGVAVRTGHHCAMPLMNSLGISGTVRASFSLYNSTSDIDRLVEAVQKARDFI